MKCKIISILLSLFVCVSLSTTQAAEKSETKSLKVLTIGNSFADSAFRYLPKIVKSVNGCKIEMSKANIGGCSLDRHWNEVLKSEKDPEYKPYYKKYTLKDKLQQKKWDIVTMQQVSSKSFKMDTYEPYFGNLYEYVKKYAPQAEIVVQMTWSYRSDHHAFGSWGVDDQNDMYNKLFKNYVAIAKKYNCRLIPSGTALQLAREQQPVKFTKQDLDDETQYKYPKRPADPEGAFIRGRIWSWRKAKDGSRKMANDRIHLNKRGQYLQACVWFAKLFDQPTSKITYIPEELGEKESKFLQGVAQQAVDLSNNDFQEK